MSAIASFISAVYIISVPAEIMYNGTMFSMQFIGYLIFTAIGAHTFLPFFHRRGKISVYEVSISQACFTLDASRVVFAPLNMSSASSGPSCFLMNLGHFVCAIEISMSRCTFLLLLALGADSSAVPLCLGFSTCRRGSTTPSDCWASSCSAS